MRYDAIGNVHKAAIRGCLEHVSKWVYVSQWMEGDIVVYAASFWIISETSSKRVKRRREKASHHVFIITSFAFFLVLEEEAKRQKEEKSLNETFISKMRKNVMRITQGKAAIQMKEIDEIHEK